MTFNPPLLNQALITPAITALSDADAAAALSAPTYSPRPGLITFTTLAQVSVWGAVKTATYRAALLAAEAAGQAAGATTAQQQLGATVGLLMDLLTVGLNANDPQIPAIAQQLVSAGLVTAADVQLAVSTVSYPCGGQVATQDVTNARALMALNRAASAGWARVKAALQSAAGSVASNPSAGVQVTPANLVSAFGGN